MNSSQIRMLLPLSRIHEITMSTDCLDDQRRKSWRIEAFDSVKEAVADVDTTAAATYFKGYIP